MGLGHDMLGHDGLSHDGFVLFCFVLFCLQLSVCLCWHLILLQDLLNVPMNRNQYPSSAIVDRGAPSTVVQSGDMAPRNRHVTNLPSQPQFWLSILRISFFVLEGDTFLATNFNPPLLSHIQWPKRSLGVPEAVLAACTGTPPQRPGLGFWVPLTWGQAESLLRCMGCCTV